MDRSRVVGEDEAQTVKGVARDTHPNAREGRRMRETRKRKIMDIAV